MFLFIYILFYFQISFLCSPRLHLFDKKYSKNSNIVNHYYNNKKKYIFYFNIF